MDSLHLAQWSYLDKYPSGTYILGKDGSTKHVPYVKTSIESTVARDNTSKIIDSGTNMAVEEGFLVNRVRGSRRIKIILLIIVLLLILLLV